jgi:hypothetical protein
MGWMRALEGCAIAAMSDDAGGSYLQDKDSAFGFAPSFGTFVVAICNGIFNSCVA